MYVETATLICVITLIGVCMLLAIVVSKASEAEEGGGSKKVKASIWIPTAIAVVALLASYVSAI